LQLVTCTQVEPQLTSEVPLRAHPFAGTGPPGYPGEWVRSAPT
jgi:hypothetical protein